MIFFRMVILPDGKRIKETIHQVKVQEGRGLAKKKYEMITELYAGAVKEVTAEPEHWMSFLSSACRNFRLPFDEQLLVHVQRPKATAVLEMEVWNRKFGRWVKRGSKGIAVIDKSSPVMRLKYYYDISETQEGRYRRLLRPVPLWKVDDENRERVRETLANAFGVSEGIEDFAQTIREAAKNAAEDNFADYLQDILSLRKNSFLEEADEQSIETEVQELLENSIAYMVMIRCGVDEREHPGIENFQGITKFHTPELVNLFGVAVSDVSEMALSGISDTIQKLQLEEKRKKRTFAGREKAGYTGLETPEYSHERSLTYDDDRIQQAGRLPFSKSHRTPRIGSTPWEIWITPLEVSEGTPLRDLSEPSDAGKIEQPPSGDTGNGTEQDGTNDIGNGKGTERDRRAESTESAFVGSEDEQHPSGGGGDHDEGGGVRLVQETVPEPEKKSAGDQSSAFFIEPKAKNLEWYDRSRDTQSLPFFHKDETIKALLLSTPYLKATKDEIQAFYEEHEDEQERAEYIRNLFNADYTDLTLEDGTQAGYKTYQNVLHMWEGAYQSRTSEGYYDWSVIARYFEGMRLLGELTDKAKPIRTVEGQLSLLDEMAEEQTFAFSFSQEIIDSLIRTTNYKDNIKYQIYSYFQKHPESRQKKAEYLKKVYGVAGAYSAITGTGIDLITDAGGMQIIRGETKITLKWEKVAKRIDELAAMGRYLSKKELENLPEYEKNVLCAEIYEFYYNLPEGEMRPYPSGTDYHTGVKLIRQQIEDPEAVGNLLESVGMVLDSTAESDRMYKFMRQAYQDLLDYRDGVYGLSSSLPAEKEDSLSMEPEDFSYVLRPETVVYIGIEEYEIQFLSDEMVVSSILLQISKKAYDSIEKLSALSK